MKSSASSAEDRAYEKFNLELALAEARKSAELASDQLKVARTALVVAVLQRTATLFWHDFAVQTLAFLRNRTLNTEMWRRLANLIRGVNDTYLHYAVKLAFLAEQAYELEADKRINGVRFDYDEGEFGGMLGADLLLKDLDTLERDLIVAQRLRQQQVRHVLSLAREFPEVLQALRETGSTIFTVRLEQLERRFPGLYNLRICSVELMPVALMDPTRFSAELTYLGTGQVRLKSQPDTPSGVASGSPLNRNERRVAQRDRCLVEPAARELPTVRAPSRAPGGAAPQSW